jgi:hypothetical protein
VTMGSTQTAAFTNRQNSVVAADVSLDRICDASATCRQRPKVDHTLSPESPCRSTGAASAKMNKPKPKDKPFVIPKSMVGRRIGGLRPIRVPRGGRSGAGGVRGRPGQPPSHPATDWRDDPRRPTDRGRRPGAPPERPPSPRPFCSAVRRPLERLCRSPAMEKPPRTAGRLTNGTNSASGKRRPSIGALIETERFDLAWSCHSFPAAQKRRALADTAPC